MEEKDEYRGSCNEKSIGGCHLPVTSYFKRIRFPKNFNFTTSIFVWFLGSQTKVVQCFC